MVLFHDMAETRVGDIDHVQRAYLQADKERAAADQVAPRGAIADSILSTWQDVERASTPAGRLAKDAELLELAFSTRELAHKGHADAQLWLESIARKLQSDVARTLSDKLRSADPTH